MRLYRFLSSEVEYETCYGLYSKEDVNHHATESEWNAAGDDDRFYRYGRMARCQPAYRLSPNLMTFVQFRSAWSDVPFNRFFQRATGVPLAASPLESVNAFNEGDFLRVHADALEDRQLAVVLYLSHGWQGEYGGALELTDRHGEVTTVVPAFNSLLLFDVRAESTHRVLPVQSAAGGRARLSMGGWLSRRQPDRSASTASQTSGRNERSRG